MRLRRWLCGQENPGVFGFHEVALSPNQTLKDFALLKGPAGNNFRFTHSQNLQAFEALAPGVGKP